MKGRHARNGTPKDQGMNVMRAFVRIDRLQVHDMANDVILVAYPIAYTSRGSGGVRRGAGAGRTAEHVTALTGNVEGLAAAVAFDQGDHFWCPGALIFQPTHAETRLHPQ